MSDQAANGLLALIFGSAAAVLLFVPVAAVQYRRDGRLGPGDLAVLIGGAVYGMALWTYTLLPLPDVGDYTCQHAQTRVMAFVDDLRRAAESSGAAGLGAPGRLLRSPVFLQLALNVALFVPLGVFVRLILHRGVVVATALGFAVSLLIELTQLTGVWGVYPCAYRLFDVDDLITNTTGALLGAVLSAPYAVRRRRRLAVEGLPPLPVRVTAGRRLVATLCDVLLVVLVGSAVAVAWRAYLLYARGEHLSGTGPTEVVLRCAVPLVVEAALVLLAGKTFGELVTDLRTVPSDLSRRLVKLLVGVVPLVAVLMVPGPGGGPLLLALAVTAVGGAFLSQDHRGLANAVAGLGVEIDDS